MASRKEDLERAIRFYRSGRFIEAEAVFERVVRSDRRNVPARRFLAQIAVRTGRHADAIPHLERAVALAPDKLDAHHELALAYSNTGKYRKAIDKLERVRRKLPDNPLVLCGLADVHERNGDDALAWEVLRTFLDNGTETEGMAVVLLRLLRKADRNEEAIALAERHLATPVTDKQVRHLLSLAAGRIYNGAKRYSEAFAAFKEANQVLRSPFDPKEYRERIEMLMSVFHEDNLARFPRASNTSERPVFIACMPRSGSTLVEQIIHAHPLAHGAGEIRDFHRAVVDLPQAFSSIQPYPQCLGDVTAEALDRIANDYLAALRGYAGAGATRVANKHLFNYQELGMVELLFPKARIVHIQRDRIDNCLACFMAALAPEQFPWLADQEHTGFVWRQYERLMAHWREALTVPMLDIRYEDLVENTEAETRRLIDFLGLPWDDKCLRYYEADRTVMTLSYDQVRRPIYKSALRRSDHYAEFLGPLRASLGPDIAGVEG